MTFYLLTRDETGALIRSRSSASTFSAAVRLGKSLFSWGQFHVECPDGYIPTRDEQLLVAKPSKKPTKKEQSLLDTL